MKINTQSFSKRWRIYAPTAAMLLIALAYSIYWFSLSASLLRNVDKWIEEQNQQGYSISYGSLEVSGYPFRLHIDLTDVTVSEPGHPNRWTWNASHLVGLTLPYKLNHIILESRGSQRINYQENLGPVARAPFHYSVAVNTESARTSLVFSKQKLVRLSIDLVKLNATRLGPDGDQVLAAERLQIHSRPLIRHAGMSTLPSSPSSGLDLFLQADALSLPFDDTFSALPAAPIDTIKINILMPDMDSTALNFSSFAIWAEGEGNIELTSSHILWDQIDITASGAFHLDEQARLEGEISSLIGGHNQLVDLLIDSGALDQNSGALMTSGLGLLAAFSGDPQGRIKTSVRIKEGDVFLGPAKIGSVGPIISPYH